MALVKISPLTGSWESPQQTETRDCEDLLIIRARQRDRRAFDRLIDQHLKPLRTFLRKRLPTEAVEDALQETLIGAWEGLPRYHTHVRFRAWLFRIALYKSADVYRHQARRPETALPEADVHIARDSQRAYETIERRDAIQTLLESLGENQREVLELYYYAEMTLPEIARSTGRNLNTVKYQFYAAHSRAARILEQESAREGSRT